MHGYTKSSRSGELKKKKTAEGPPPPHTHTHRKSNGQSLNKGSSLRELTAQRIDPKTEAWKSHKIHMHTHIIESVV